MSAGKPLRAGPWEQCQLFSTPGIRVRPWVHDPTTVAARAGCGWFAFMVGKDTKCARVDGDSAECERRADEALRALGVVLEDGGAK